MSAIEEGKNNDRSPVIESARKSDLKVLVKHCKVEDTSKEIYRCNLRSVFSVI